MMLAHQQPDKCFLGAELAPGRVLMVGKGKDSASGVKMALRRFGAIAGDNTAATTEHGQFGSDNKNSALNLDRRMKAVSYRDRTGTRRRTSILCPFHSRPHNEIHIQDCHIDISLDSYFYPIPKKVLASCLQGGMVGTHHERTK